MTDLTKEQLDEIEAKYRPVLDYCASWLRESIENREHRTTAEEVISLIAMARRALEAEARVRELEVQLGAAEGL